ncbi:MAG: ester cyclase [Phycisphaerae bacterium]|jgi:predicted ester cyclase
MVDAVNARNLSALDDIIAPNYVRHCQATPDVHVRNLDEFKRFLETDFAAVPDSVVTTKWMISEGDLLAFYCTYAGTQTGQMGPFPPSGRAINVDFSGVHRFENGKIAETWLTWDNFAGLVQLGHLPAPNRTGR